MKFKNTFGVALISIFLAIALSVPAGICADRENFSVGNLTVEKTARIDGLLQAVANTTGNVFYVNDATGINGIGGAGRASSKPLASLDYAIGRCTADNGDFIILMPGHSESGTAANLFDADVAGITILGLGDGAEMPTFTFSDTDTTVAIGAENVSIYNVRFAAGISAVVIGVAVEAAGDNFLMSDCVFPEPTTSSFEFVDAIDLAALADNVTIQNTTFFNADAIGGSHFVEAGNGVNKNLQLLNNYVYGEFGVAAIWSNKADEEVRIEGGTYVNLTNGQHAIEFTSTATGMIKDVLVRTDVQATAVDPGSMTMSNVLWDSDTTADSVAVPVVSSGSGADTIGTINDTTTDSLHGKIGTDTEMADSSLYDMLEAVAVSSGPAYNTPNYLAVIADMDIATWNTTGTHEILTVTGAVKLRVLAQCTENMTGVTTLELGTANNTAEIIAQIADAEDLDALEIWNGATPSVESLSGTDAIIEAVVVGGVDVGYTVGASAFTNGTIIFHIWWTPLDATGAAVAGVGGSL